MAAIADCSLPNDPYTKYQHMFVYISISIFGWICGSVAQSSQQHLLRKKIKIIKKKIKKLEHFPSFHLLFSRWSPVLTELKKFVPDPGYRSWGHVSNQDILNAPSVFVWRALLKNNSPPPPQKTCPLTQQADFSSNECLSTCLFLFH